MKAIRTFQKISIFFSLIFLSALSVSWAARCYSGSSRVTRGGGGGFYLVKGKDKVNVSIDKNSLNDYLDEQGLDNVKITADLEEEWVDTGNGNGYYRLNFTFGPSGAHFSTGLLLTITGKYAANPNVELYDENGEPLESNRNDCADRVTIRVPHFSNYYYDNYTY